MRFEGIKWGVLPLVAAALMACGGGGNPQPEVGGNSQPDGTPVATATISGVVAKGPAEGASVRIFNASGQQVGPTERSGPGGRYTIVIPASEVGPFRLEADLSGATINSETGGTYTGAAGQVLRAVVERRQDTVHLTPFSDMAADLVGSGSLTPEAVQTANRKISQILNATDFLTSAPTEGNLLVALTAVQRLVDNNRDNGGLTTVLEQFRTAASSGPNGLVVSRDFVQALQNACGTAAGCAERFKPEFAAVPLTVVQSNDVDLVKALVQNLRNTLMALSNDQGNGELDQAGNRIQVALQSAVQPIDDEQIKLVALSLDADRMFRAFKAGDTSQRRRDFGDAFGRTATTESNGTPVPVGRLPQFRCEVGRASFTRTSGGQPDISFFTAVDSEVTPLNANMVSCFGVGTVGRLVPGAGDGFGYYHSLNLIPQESGHLAYVHQVRRQEYDRRGPTERVGAAYGSMLTVRDSAGELTGVTINGSLKPGFKGQAPAVYRTLDRVNTTLNISTTQGTSTASLNVSGSMVLMKLDGTEASRVEITSGSFAARTDTGDTASLGSLNLDVSVSAPGVRFQGNATADQPSFDSSRTAYLPTAITLRGRLSEADGASGYRVLLDGTGTAMLTNFSTHNASSNAQAPLQVSFTGSLLLRNRPPMGFSFVAARDAADNRSGTGSFFWNERLLNFAAQPATGSLVVSNDAGVSFTIPRNGSAQWQDIRRSGVLLGRINLDQQRIEFADGTFEQF